MALRGCIVPILISLCFVGASFGWEAIWAGQAHRQAGGRLRAARRGVPGALQVARGQQRQEAEGSR